MAPLQKSVTIIIHRGKSDELNTVAGVKNKVFKALPLTNTLLFFKSLNSSLAEILQTCIQQLTALVVEK